MFELTFHTIIRIADIIEGSLELIPNCTCFTDTGTRNSQGQVNPELQGETDVNWERQTQMLNEQGFGLFVTDAGAQWPSNRLVLFPEFAPAVSARAQMSAAVFDKDSITLPVRRALLDEYVVWLAENPITFEGMGFAEATLVFDDIAVALGFSMTAREKSELLKELQA